MIENELKYVVDLRTKEDILFIISSIDLGIKVCDIIQFYHKDGGRFRKSNSTYTFNYKVDLGNGLQEEFEMPITKQEFDRVFPFAKEIVKKLRYSFIFDDNIWDIDFFYNEKKEFYFGLAECEMKGDLEKPASYPYFIQDNLIYEVPRKDGSLFTSKKLSNETYAKKLLVKILKK